MNNDAGGLLVLVGIVLAIFTIGFWSATSMYKHDTFDCTNSCGGKHSIYNTNTKICYCEVELK
jgi:6-phosphogluconolactonase (cycloisomerase 2 family)